MEKGHKYLGFDRRKGTERMIPAPGIIAACTRGPGPLLPTDFPELRSWWEYTEAPPNSTPGNPTWPARAGTQATTLTNSGTSFSTALYTGAPAGPITTYGLGVSTPVWAQVDGLTYFVVTQVAAPSILFLMTTNNPPTPRQFALYTDNSEMRVAKQDGSGIATGITVTGRVGVPISWVVSFGHSPGNEVRVRAKAQGGSLETFNGTSAISFGSPAGMNFNGTSGGSGWARPIVRAGVIGRLLTSDECDELCLANAAAFGF